MRLTDHHLENVVGRGAGTYEDYDYSIALEASGIVWTPAALRAWMEDNDGFMPGTKMRHVGIEDRTVQGCATSRGWARPNAPIICSSSR